MNEATLLQNVGATYNEKQMYSESLAYHREAASMHGIYTIILYVHTYNHLTTGNIM